MYMNRKDIEVARNFTYNYLPSLGAAVVNVCKYIIFAYVRKHIIFSFKTQLMVLG